ncbi:unnamed protein product [Hymenolepis diminuta]|uniref:Uncharacterized protein n=1 Tax=Hymenolepis diminuta TaxID=6216 RepID=A0A564XZC8_HYMDI|nr:unnamed protein product [Hymenolepis diminuta]
MTGKIQVKKTKYVIRKIITERYSNDLQDGTAIAEDSCDESSCDYSFLLRNQQDQKRHRRRKKNKRREQQIEGNKEEAKSILTSDRDDEDDCETCYMTFVKNFHRDIADPIEKFQEDKRASSHPNEDQRSVSENDQKEPENPITEHQSTSSSNFSQSSTEEGEDSEEKIKALGSAIAAVTNCGLINDGLISSDPVDPITEEYNDSYSASDMHSDPIQCQNSPKPYPIPVREPEITPIILESNKAKLNTRIVDISNDFLKKSADMEFDLFEFLIMWLWKWLEDIFQTIYLKTTEIIDTYWSNKNSVVASRSRVLATINNKARMEKYGIFREIMEDSESIAVKAPTSNVVRSKSTSHLKPEAETYLSGNVQKQSVQKLWKSPIPEKRIILKIQRDGNVEIIDTDRNLEVLRRPKQINTPISKKPEAGEESRLPVVREIDGDIDRAFENVSNTPLSDEPEVKEQSESLVKEPVKKTECETSKSSHVASLTNCFKFLMEKFYPESATEMAKRMVFQGKKLNEVSDQEDIVTPSVIHEASLTNCYTFLVEEFHPYLAAVLKKYCNGQELVIGQ